MENFQRLFDSFATLRVGVIGDVMLDTYMWGSVDRISPEAPVPVVQLKEKEYRIGGAGNVALRHPPGTTMTYNPVHPLLRRWLAGVLAALIGLGPLATPAYSALIPLADEPLNVKNSAHPNIVLTVDDSTSMLDDFLPDYVVSAYCRNGTGAMTAGCGIVGATSDFTLVGGGKYSSPGYIFEQYNFPTAGYTGSYDPSGPGAGCYGGSPPTCSSGSVRRTTGTATRVRVPRSATGAPAGS